MQEKVKAYRTQLAENFIHVLEEKGLDWKKEWSGISNLPYNVKSKAVYKGINRFRLLLVSAQRKYTDSRWATFRQVQEMGLKLKNAKGQGVKVEYWYPYDRQTHQVISWDEFRNNAGGAVNERYMLLASYSTVFNGALIDGLPKEPKPEKQEIAIDNIITTLSANMDVEILNDGGDRAFYRPSEDKIHLPKPEFFYSDYAYNSTALHELAHSTGAEKRLNRNMGGKFGTEGYAYEELVAEIASCFMSVNLQTEQTQTHIENHKAYVQSWISSIRESPELLVKAVADAEKASAYMDYKAELITKQEYEKVYGSSLQTETKLLEKRKTQQKHAEIRGPKL